MSVAREAVVRVVGNMMMICLFDIKITHPQLLPSTQAILSIHAFGKTIASCLPRTLFNS